MEEQEAIALNIRLPAGALEGFTRLVEQLRYLAAEISGSGGGAAAAPVRTMETGENSSFDPVRFQGMDSVSDGIRPVDASVRNIVHPGAVRTEVSAGPAVPASAGEIDAASLEASRIFQSEAQPQVRDVPASAEEDREMFSQLDDPAEPAISDITPAAEPETVQADVPSIERDTPAPQRFTLSAPDPPLSAGFAVSSLPEASIGRWNGITEELAGAADAPMTAQAVSQAFRRDGRRYDNGFPLY